MRQKSSFSIGFKHLLLTLGVLLLFVSMSTSAFATATSDTYVRIVHAAPNAGNVDVYVDQKEVLKNFAFATATSYLSVPGGEHTIRVVPTGKNIRAAVLRWSTDLTAGNLYTVAVVGSKEKGFRFRSFLDNNALGGASAKVRVYHLSPNAGPVDVTLGGKKVITGLEYNQVSPYLTVPAGAQAFNVNAIRARATVPLNATIKEGTINSIFAIGFYKGTPPLQFLVSTVPGTK
ncbi:cell wall anchor [Dictyobacter alpinus]|uniref:Cell wall anchor n=1 Tax=Dictyobacter alpinus TaxID=2014873 RepID=A0A402B1I5_9CHLR|nr:DUF4397 domain-containing protein [Dictyobacter alpinus]GCE25230.1 cell wall anchor [Dictyobacter alpinus]